MDENQQLIARYEPWRIALGLIVSLGFVAVGIWMLNIDPASLNSRHARELEFLSPWLPWLTIVLFGGCAVAWGRNIFNKRPQLVVNETGLYWLKQGIYWREQSENLISWVDIENVELGSTKSTKFISLKLKDPSAYPAGGLASVFARRKSMNGNRHVSIATIALDRSAEEILASIEHYLTAGGAHITGSDVFEG